MNKIIILSIVILILATACSPKIQIVELNHTIKEVQVIETKCLPVECVCNYPGAECEPKTIIDPACKNKLNLCHIRLDTTNDYLYDCMQMNNTVYSDNLTIEFNKCREENKELEGKLENISRLIE